MPLRLRAKLAYSLQRRSKSKLVRQADSHLRMLKHVAITDSAESVLCSVYVATCIGEGTLNDESRWVASLGCARVVRAGIAALSLDIWDSAVLDIVKSQAGKGLRIILTAVTTLLIKDVNPAST
jgi:hypothetical protein